MDFNPRSVLYTFDKPVSYKKLEIFPVLMSNYYEFSFFASCLLLEKTTDPDPLKTIPMTYLQYLFYKASEENRLVYLLDGLLRLVLGKITDDDFSIEYWVDKKSNLPIFKVDGEIYDSSDFDNLRSLIAEQNSLDLPREEIQKTVRDSLEKARKYRQKISGRDKMASLEDQIIALSIYSGWSLESIYGLSIRKFKKALLRANHMLHQKIYLQAEMSGMVSFKDKSVLTGWLADIEQDDDYEDVTMEIDSLKSKVDFSEAKK